MFHKLILPYICICPIYVIYRYIIINGNLYKKRFFLRVGFIIRLGANDGCSRSEALLTHINSWDAKLFLEVVIYIRWKANRAWHCGYVCVNTLDDISLSSTTIPYKFNLVVQMYICTDIFFRIIFNSTNSCYGWLKNYLSLIICGQLSDT